MRSRPLSPERGRQLGAILGLLVLAWLAHRLYGYRHELQLSWRELSWPLLGAAFAAFFAAQLLFARGWHRLLAGHGVAGAWRADFARWCATLAGKYLPGRIWHGLARVGAYRHSAGPATIAPAFLRELLLTISAAMALVALHGLLDHRVPPGLPVPMALGAALCGLLAMPWAGSGIRSLLARAGFDFALGQARAADLLATWGLQLGGYLLLGVGMVTLGHAITGLPQDLWAAGIAALCFGGVAGIAAFFVPAGIGVREAALAWYLQPFIGPGPAALLAVASRAWLTLGDLCLVTLGLWLLRREKRA